MRIIAFFRRYYLPGDTFEAEDSTVTPSQLRTLTVESISSDTELRLTELPAFSVDEAKYFVNTKVYTRPSGSFIHRPFDGGVEIKAGSSPNSVITRQTRKYFRLIGMIYALLVPILFAIIPIYIYLGLYVSCFG